MLILAGAHSLGTAAACLAATRSPLVKMIKDALPADIDLANKAQPFWVLVRGEASPTDNLLDEKDVTIVETGGYSPTG